MGKVAFVLNIEGVSDSQIATVKSAIDTQIATWTSTYPTLTFTRGGIQWSE